MFIIILMTVVSALSIGMQIKDSMEYKKVYDLAFSKNKYECIYQSKFHIILYFLILVATIILFIGGISAKDTTAIALGIVLFGIDISQILSINYSIKFYYNDSGILTNGKNIRYRSIKSINRKNFSIGSIYELTTLSNEKCKINQKAADKILEHCRFEFTMDEELKIRKKEILASLTSENTKNN